MFCIQAKFQPPFTSKSSPKSLATLVRTKKGFTLVELLCVVSLLIIVIVIAYPHFSNSLRNQEANEFTTLVFLLKKARHNALIQAKPVIVCELGANGQCLSTWKNTISAFVDTNKNNAFDQQDMMLQTQNLNLKYGQVVIKRAAGLPYIRFTQHYGFAIGSNGSLQYCSDFSQFNHAIIISDMGHTRLAHDFNGDGTRELRAGTSITC